MMVALLLTGQLAFASALAPAQLAAAGPADKIEVLKTWVEAVEQHRPGELDAALVRIRGLSRPQLERLRIDLRSLLTLVRDPRSSVFYADANVTTRSVPLVYTAGERDALKALAGLVAGRGDGNRLLRRSAVAHTDIAMLAPPDAGTPTGGRASSLQRTLVYVEDGRQVSRVEAIDHWGMSRRLLDEVRSRPNRDPDPASDAGVRLWYHAMSAYFQADHQVTLPHFGDATRTFPDDSEILFLAGAMREMASAPGVFATVRRDRNPFGAGTGIGSEEEEMRLAESLFRRALAVSPRHIEARLHLGRVLTRLGRHDAAVKELRLVTASTEDPRLSYYGHLFLGGALDRQRDAAGATAAYERAAALFPKAQSPRLAISQLQARAGDRRAALESAMSTLGRQAEFDDDPLWTYDVSAGRDANALLIRMYAALAPEPVR